MRERGEEGRGWEEEVVVVWYQSWIMLRERDFSLSCSGSGDNGG